MKSKGLTVGWEVLNHSRQEQLCSHWTGSADPSRTLVSLGTFDPAPRGRDHFPLNLRVLFLPGWEDPVLSRGGGQFCGLTVAMGVEWKGSKVGLLSTTYPLSVLNVHLIVSLG